MPFKSEKIKLPQEYDRRRKLTDEQKDEIKHKYSTGLYSLNNLAIDLLSFNNIHELLGLFRVVDVN